MESVTYFPPWLGRMTNVTGSADRPLCAVVAALASWNGANVTHPSCGLWGAARAQPAEWVREWAERETDLPWERLQEWAMAVRAPEVGLADPGLAGWEFPLRDGRVLKLDAYQREAVRKATPMGSLLSFTMGLGKTVTGLALARAYLALGHASTPRLYVVAPVNAMDAWESSLPSVRAYFSEIELVSQDILHRLEGLPSTGGVIIYDEAHCLGMTTARRTQAAHVLRTKFDCGICLTGTALHAGVEKTLSMADLCVPGMGSFSSRWKMGEYLGTLHSKMVPGRPRPVKEIADPDPADPKFLGWFTRFAQVLRLDSPEVLAAGIDVPAQDKHEVRVREPWPSHEDAVVSLVRAKLAAGEPLPEAAAILHELARQGGEHKLRWLEENWTPDSPLIVFAHYLDSLDLLQGWATSQGIPWVRIDGAAGVKDRREAVRRMWSGEALLFLGQWKAASVSIDLTCCTESIGFDHSFSATDYDQALARPHRRGQAKVCTHVDLVANHLQKAVLARVRERLRFDAKCAEWVAAKGALDCARLGSTVLAQPPRQSPGANTCPRPSSLLLLIPSPAASSSWATAWKARCN